MKNLKNVKNKLVLGTVQFGMKYGLHNKFGQPSKEESFVILDTALASGIDTFDTAWAYGTAEDIIGEWVENRRVAEEIKIISKMKPHALNDYPDGTKATEIVQVELEKSLKRLKVKKLDGYLFHSPYYVYLKHAIAGLQKAKDSGLVNSIGVSIYDIGEALQAVELGVDYVQIPYNVFDQRLDSTNFFDIAKKNNVKVFARSPFLQGLLLMQPSELPNHLSYLTFYLEKYIRICKKYNFFQTEMALNFASLVCRADHIVFGVEKVEQLEENINYLNKNASKLDVDGGWADEIKNAFKDLNHGAINPSLWSKINL